MRFVNFCLLFAVFSIAAYATDPVCIATGQNKYGCANVITCTETTGVCDCANGKRCVWTNSGNQIINCPCFDLDADTYNTFKTLPTTTSEELYCLSKFTDNNCGYETTCSQTLDSGTCKCADGKVCVWNADINVNCPCSNTVAYPNLVNYIGINMASCMANMTAFNCAAPVHCVEGIGSCTCPDGTLCAWGPSYQINCPCTVLTGSP